MVTFDHLAPGTPEETWQQAFYSGTPPEFAETFDALLVVAAHPDDETLGAGGLIRMASLRGTHVTVVVATDGENSHPDSSTHTPHSLAKLRRREVQAALRILCPTADLRFLGIPDGALRENTDAFAETIGTMLDELGQLSRRVLTVAPWAGDGHRDHRIAGDVTAAQCLVRKMPFRAYPIWLWHWGEPQDVPWGDVECVTLDDETRTVKADAIAQHDSQIMPLSDEPGDEAILHPQMQAHFVRDFEVLLRAPQPAAELTLSEAYFDAFYTRNDDPWGFDSRWYEQRKRALLLATLPASRYARGLELGCATGALTVELAERCDQLVAVDFAQSALNATRERLASVSNVELRAHTLPQQWPDGDFDLIILSEIGYYWDASDLELAMERIVGSLAPDGHLVACHWRHPVADYPISGDGVHVALRTQPKLVCLARHEEEDFLMEAFAHPPGASVARATGLIA